MAVGIFESSIHGGELDGRPKLARATLRYRKNAVRTKACSTTATGRVNFASLSRAWARMVSRHP